MQNRKVGGITVENILDGMPQTVYSTAINIGAYICTRTGLTLRVSLGRKNQKKRGELAQRKYGKRVVQRDNRERSAGVVNKD